MLARVAIASGHSVQAMRDVRRLSDEIKVREAALLARRTAECADERLVVSEHFRGRHASGHGALGGRLISWSGTTLPCDGKRRRPPRSACAWPMSASMWVMR